MKLNKIKQRLQHVSVNITKRNRNIHLKIHLTFMFCLSSPFSLNRRQLWIEIFFWFSPLLIFYLWHFIFILHLAWIEQFYSKLYTVSYLEIKIPTYSKLIYMMRNLILTESIYCLFANIAHLITVTDNLKWSDAV